MWSPQVLVPVVMVTLYFNAGLIPWFLTMNNLGLYQDFLAYVVPTIVQPFNIILVKTYIENIPKELPGAALTGNNTAEFFWQVMLPITKADLAISSPSFFAVGQLEFLSRIPAPHDQRKLVYPAVYPVPLY